MRKSDNIRRAYLRITPRDNEEDGFELDFVWAPALQNLYRGHPDEFCELLRDYKFPIPAAVRNFLADVFDGTAPPPPKKRQRDTMDVWERQAIHVAAIAHRERKASGMGRAELSAKRKAAVYELAQRHGRTWDTVEKLFKAELRRLENARDT